MTGELAKALVAAQKQMPAVKDDATADTGKFKYAYVTLDHLIAQTKPHLQAHGLTIVQFPAVLETGQPVLRTLLLHESGEQLSADTPLLMGEKTMQQLGSAITYARRYGWASVLAISAEEDDDGKAASTTAAKPKAGAKSAVKSEEPAQVNTDRVAALVQLVKQKGGDYEKTAQAAKTAADQGKLDTWLPNAEEYWRGQPESYANKIPESAKAA